MPLLNESVNSNYKLREYAKQEWEQHSKIYTQISNNSLKQEIEKLIELKGEEWLYKIKELLKRKENIVFKNRDDELKLVEQLCICSEKERKEGSLSLLYQCNSLQQIRVIYQITVFYLTRIELDMEEEYYIEFLNFIKEWNLSPEYMAMTIRNGSLCNKLRTGKKVVEILKKYGEENYGEEVLKSMMEKGM